MNILSLDKYFVLCKSDESSSLFSVFVRAKIVSSSIRYFSINASGRFGEKAEERKEAGSTNRLVPRLMRPVALTRSVYTKSKVTGKWIDQRSNILEGRRALLLSPTTAASLASIIVVTLQRSTIQRYLLPCVHTGHTRCIISPPVAVQPQLEFSSNGDRSVERNSRVNASITSGDNRRSNVSQQS